MAKSDIDSDLVRKMADLLEDTGLTEIEYAHQDGWHIRVAKGGMMSAPVVAAPAAPAPAAAVAPAAEASAADLANHPGAVSSPMVGVAYLNPDPDSPQFVNLGDTVTEGQTLMLIEAMKVFNPIHAPKAGKVTQILVENGSPVEYGEPLIIIE